MSGAQRKFVILARAAAAALLVAGTAMAAASAQMRTPSQAPLASPDPQAVAPDFRQLRSDSGRVHSPDELFAVFDVNQDGCIDDGEWRRRVMAVFFILDTEGNDPVTGRAGGDGRLTRAEVPNLREDLFRAADIDHDGAISGFEFNQASFTRFEAVSRQDQNCLTPGEFTAYVRSLRGNAL